ncbi:MAG TPA: HAMP domain-containing histidine kinase [Candidatus Mediterraneibacter intestinavium]|nr:HAMP domain-containing histidine kinase [Candidatus Mediterraneibacter intestinavium]
MEFWIYVLIGILIIIILALTVKIILLQKSADEIAEEFADRLTSDTNTLIGISSRDRHMRKLAKDINNELNKLKKDLQRFQRGDLELKDAVTNISHDLRTPLTAICGYLELLEKEKNSANAERYIRVIRERTDSLKQLTEELFRYSVFTTSSDGTSPEPVVLNRLLEESISAYYGALKQHRITPRITLPERNVIRHLNRNACSRIFGNLISNAIKYSDGGLDITLGEDGEITFSNHAAHLDEIQAGRLFDRFYTVETASAGSTGLGLSIARALTEQMGASIDAVYEDGILSVRLFFRSETPPQDPSQT